MTETTSSPHDGLNRRAALDGSGVAAAFGVHGQLLVAAQDDDLAGHPLAGVWMAMGNPPLPEDPQIAVPSLFAADGTVVLVFPVTQRGPEGPVFNSPYLGTWEPDSDRRGHFTAIQVISAADGTFLGTITVDGYPEVSEDGQRFIDDGSRVTVTIRDAAGMLVDQVLPTGQPAGRPVTGAKMGVGVSGWADMGEAIPTSS